MLKIKIIISNTKNNIIINLLQTKTKIDNKNNIINGTYITRDGFYTHRLQ